MCVYVKRTSNDNSFDVGLLGYFILVNIPNTTVKLTKFDLVGY